MIRLNDSNICTFERTLCELGFVRTIHSYNSNTMFDVWEGPNGVVWHVDQVRSAGNDYIATRRDSEK